MGKTKERRRFRRLKNGVRVIFKVLHKKGENELPSLNIGAGGVCVPLKNKLKPGELLELGLILPSEGKPFYSFAKVVWQTSIPKKDDEGNSYFETSVEFVRMNSSDRKKLIRYIYSLLKNK